MGLIKNDGYILKGVKIKPAYTKITRLYNEKNNFFVAYFGISTTRENINNENSLEEISFVCEVDKSKDKIFNEIYTKAKNELFIGWEDDIV